LNSQKTMWRFSILR